MVIEVSEVVPKNALLPIESSTLPVSKVTVSRAVEKANALRPIEVTLFGMFIAVKAVVL